jgi:hypothetical protein
MSSLEAERAALARVRQLEFENTDLMSELQRVYSELDRMRAGLEMIMSMQYEPAAQLARKTLRMGHG